MMRTTKILFFVIFLLNSSFIFSQKTITGKVTDNDGLPLPSATINIKGTDKGTASDFDGNYSIEANTGDILVFSYMLVR